MKKLLAVLLLAGGSMFGAQVSFGIRIGEPPPPRVIRVRPRAPGPDYFWVDGYWYPVNGRYRWHEGYWTRPPFAGARWIAPVTMANNTSRATGTATGVVLITTTAGIATAIATGATTTGTTVIGTGIAASPQTGARADPLLRRASLAPCAAPVGGGGRDQVQPGVRERIAARTVADGGFPIPRHGPPHCRTAEYQGR